MVIKVTGFGNEISFRLDELHNYKGSPFFARTNMEF